MAAAGRTVVVFGAGATKACGGPMTNEILPLAFERQKQLEREGFIAQVRSFLKDNFSLPAQPRREDFPPLPLLLSLIDTAIDRQQSFSSTWDLRTLREVRGALEYLIFAVLEYELEQSEGRNHYHTLLRRLIDTHEEVSVISLNYDIIADNTLIELTRHFPEYGCDIATTAYRERAQRRAAGPDEGRRVALYKPHGSLNWIYCPACQRLDIGLSSRSNYTVKALEQFYGQQVRRGLDDLDNRYSCRGSKCVDRACGAEVRPIMITPTHLKDYRNPHIARVWYEAGRALRRADSVHVVGYSLPSDDVEVIYLLKSNLRHLEASRIHVVEYDLEPARPPARPQARKGGQDPKSGKGRAPVRHDAPKGRALAASEVGNRYRALFGDAVHWFPLGFEAYATSLRQP